MIMDAGKSKSAVWANRHRARKADVPVLLQRLAVPRPRKAESADDIPRPFARTFPLA